MSWLVVRLQSSFASELIALDDLNIFSQPTLLVVGICFLGAHNK
jgi:hypothetical protein